MNDTLILINGCSLQELRKRPDKSAQVCVSSPPYYGLRDYGLPHSIFGGKRDCQHEFVERRTYTEKTAAVSSAGAFSSGGPENAARLKAGRWRTSATCSTCGAWRGQLGLEESPLLFIEHLVEIYAEVWRVLKDDGTVWLNLGDSYMPENRGEAAKLRKENQFHEMQQGHMHADLPTQKAQIVAMKRDGFKRKDLLGIPWAAANALRAPYYMGDIKDERDRVWLAAMIDGEGCFYVHRRPAGQHAGGGYYRTNDTFAPAFEVANTCESIVLRCHQIAKVGSISRQDKGRRQPIYRWTVRANEAKAVAREVYPHLVAKRQQCRIICGLASNGDASLQAWAAMKLLHAGQPSAVDYPEPESLFRRGFYLRSDIIWAKPNPMPESVTDRPTKAHEYIFLLTKGERYYYDAKAIEEPQVEQERARRLREQAQGLDTRYDLRRDQPHGQNAPGQNGVARSAKARQELAQKGTRNKRSVWTVPSAPFKDAHFATFPPDLIKPCIMAGSRPGDVVLDMFGGSGTTGMVALELGRKAVLIELNPSYCEIIRQRCTTTVGLALT